MEWFPRNFIQSEVSICAIRNNLICWLNAQPYRFSTHFAAKETGNLILPYATHMSDMLQLSALNCLLHNQLYKGSVFQRLSKGEFSSLFTVGYI